MFKQIHRLIGVREAKCLGVPIVHFWFVLFVLLFFRTRVSLILNLGANQFLDDVLQRDQTNDSIARPVVSIITESTWTNITLDTLVKSVCAISTRR